MKHNDKVHAFVVWFDTIFGNLERPVTLTTSPYAKYTHWKQCVLYLDKPMQVRKGEELYGSIAVRQDKANFRALNIKMSFHMQTGKYQRHFDQ
jgi:type I protein arginine methyltransferase